jgi:hypothetical protein
MPPAPEVSLVPQKFFSHGVQNLSISPEQSCWDALERAAKPDASAGAQPIELRDIVSVRFGLPLEEATGTFPSRVSVVDDRLKREGKDSPNTKYRSRSALLQERASKLVSGSGELTTRVEPAMIGCEA